jgi:hypothetical protein
MLMLVLVASVAFMVGAVIFKAKYTCLGAALGFAIIIIDTAFSINWPIWSNAAAAMRDDPETQLHASRRNARLMAMVYGWGALALFAIYSLTELWWFHSWQYGAAMALIAAALLGFVHLLGDEKSLFRSQVSLDVSAMLAMAQAAAAAVALGMLIGSGKVGSIKADWPANHVFLAGGLALVVISVIAAITHFKLRRATVGT